MPQSASCALQEVLFILSSPNNKQKVVIELTSVACASKEYVEPTIQHTAMGFLKGTMLVCKWNLRPTIIDPFALVPIHLTHPPFDFTMVGRISYISTSATQAQQMLDPSMVPTPTQPPPPTNPPLVHKRYGSGKHYPKVEEEEKEHEMEKVRQPNQMPSKGKWFSTTKTNLIMHQM